MTELSKLLKFLGACEEARDWANGRGELPEAWAACDRPDWLLWLAAKRLPRQRVVRAACACARTALKYVPAGEDRPRIAIETAEKWARGEATLDEVRKARSYAAAYADAADADAAYAAYAAADAADAAYAAYADAAYADAAYAAADDASDAAAADDASDAARSKAQREMCDIIRSLITADDITKGDSR